MCFLPVPLPLFFFLPSFQQLMAHNTTVQLGGTAFLVCKVSGVDRVGVNWVCFFSLIVPLRTARKLPHSTSSSVQFRVDASTSTSWSSDPVVPISRRSWKIQFSSRPPDRTEEICWRAQLLLQWNMHILYKTCSVFSAPAPAQGPLSLSVSLLLPLPLPHSMPFPFPFAFSFSFHFPV